MAAAGCAGSTRATDKESIDSLGLYSYVCLVVVVLQVAGGVAAPHHESKRRLRRGIGQAADLHVSPAGQRDGTAERIMLRELLRRVEMKVIQENRLDVVVRLHTSLPPGKIGLAPWPNPPGDTRSDMPMGPNAGETEVLIPADYVREVYDARFALSDDRKDYDPVNTDTPTMLSEPGLPFSLVFRAEPGAKDRILRVASAYEAASKRRISPPRFGPLHAGTN